MKRKANTGSGVYQYLEASGVLDTGSGDDIAKMRKKYWREYKRLWKQERRMKQTEFKIYFTSKELLAIAAGAKKHTTSRTNYIKQAALAYTAKQYLVPDIVAVTHIRRLLELNLVAIDELISQSHLASNTSSIVMQKMASLEQKVLDALCNPQTVSNTSKMAVL